MNEASQLSIANSTAKWKTILTAGLLAGILDGAAAVISTYIQSGKGFETVFRFVASGVFGSEAFKGSSAMIVAGVLFHMCIAMTWAIILFYIYPLLKGFGTKRVLVGLLYGIFVWICMNQIVVPLSNTPKFPFRLVGALKGMAIIMVCVGLPLGLIIGKYYSRAKTSV